MNVGSDLTRLKPKYVRSEVYVGDPMVCDFCSSVDVTWAYPAGDFQPDPDLPQASAGGWAACEPCAELIEAGDWEGLTDRATDAAVKRSGGVLDASFIRPQLRQLYAVFSEFRTGPRRPI